MGLIQDYGATIIWPRQDPVSWQYHVEADVCTIRLP
jgi:hypothetical protein